MMDKVSEFNDKHKTVNQEAQFKILIEEIGELSEAILQNEGLKISKENDKDIEDIKEELGDVGFTLYSIADLYNIDLDKVIDKTVMENLNK